MLRTPSAWAPSSIDSSPITDQSRVVRCGIVSIPASRSIAAEIISELIPARAVALSLMSTQPTLPDSFSSRATSTSPELFPPSGGSSCTDKIHSPSRSARARPVSRCSSPRETTSSRSSKTSGARGLRSSSTAERIAAISAGVVPQQPPITFAPRSRAWAANSAKYSGAACG